MADTDLAQHSGYDHPLTTFPARDDWGGWVEVWCREDTGNIDCVPEFMRRPVMAHVTDAGWFKRPMTGLNTPYKFARYSVPMEAGPPWRGTGLSPMQAKEAYFEALDEYLNPPEPEAPVKKWVKPAPGEHLYFIASASGHIKIGVSYDPERRLKDLQTSNPLPLRLLLVVEGAGNREAEYHARFSEHRREGEWFDAHPDILAEIERLTGKTDPQKP